MARYALDGIHRIGEEIDNNNRPAFYILYLSDFVDDIEYEDIDFPDSIDKIYPKNYFITSGDATLKAKQLCKDLNIILNNMKNMKNCKESQEAIKLCINQANHLYEQLVIAKGDDCFLETEWGHDGTLKCIPKNPRNK